MKRLLIGAVEFLALLAVAVASADTPVPIAGLDFYRSKEKLDGSLIFYFTGVPSGPNTSTNASGLYEWKLDCQALHRVAPGPRAEAIARFLVSRDGEDCCAILRTGALWSAFAYCRGQGRAHSLPLPSLPDDALTSNCHVLFNMEMDHGRRILDYDMTGETRRVLELPGGSRWKREDFTRLHVHPAKPNELHFKYFYSGDRIAGGKDYPKTFYSYDLGTGRVLPEVGLDGWDQPTAEKFRTSDGRFVWFAGEGSPLSGWKLMASFARDEKHQLKEDLPGEGLKVLRRFPKSRWTSYELTQMSPCRRYALVLQTDQIPVPYQAGNYRHVLKYHVVNAGTGKSWVVLKNEVEHRDEGIVSEVWWVLNDPRKR